MCVNVFVYVCVCVLIIVLPAVLQVLARVIMWRLVFSLLRYPTDREVQLKVGWSSRLLAFPSSFVPFFYIFFTCPLGFCLTCVFAYLPLCVLSRYLRMSLPSCLTAFVSACLPVCLSECLPSPVCALFFPPHVDQPGSQSPVHSVS